jgi:hypothetical protein
MIAALACWSKIGANGGNRVQPGRPDACRRRTGFHPEETPGAGTKRGILSNSVNANDIRCSVHAFAYTQFLYANPYNPPIYG